MTTSNITLPNGITVQIPHSEGYIVNQSGVYEGYTDQASRLCDLIWLDTNIRYIDNRLTMARLKFVDAVTGGVESFDCPRSQLIPDYAVVLIKTLADFGFNIEPGKQQKVLKYLLGQTAAGFQLATNKIGWYETNLGRYGFVLPSKSFSPGETPALFVPTCPTPVHRNLKASCSPEVESLHINELICGNPYLVFVRGIGLAAPFMQIMEVEAGGFHLYSHSSRGKTTLAQLAASVWGKGSDPQMDAQGSILQRWNTTANALEGTAQAFNDLLLTMDEIGTNNTKNFGAAIYNLTGGKGKAAMTANRGMRQEYTWRNLILSTGEYSITDYVADSAGSNVATGQKIRMLDIPIPDEVFQNTGGLGHGEFADKIKHVSSTYYGASGEALVEHLVTVANDPEQLYAMKTKYLAMTHTLVGSIKPPEQQRAIKRFALVELAIETASEIGLINIRPDEAHTAVETVLDSWLENSPLLSDVDAAIYNLARKLKTEPGLFADSNDPTRKLNGKLAGYYDRQNRRYMVLITEFASLFGNRANKRKVLHKLSVMGHLHQNNTDGGIPRLSSRYNISSVGPVNAYGIEPSFLDDYGSEVSSDEEVTSTAIEIQQGMG